jgi:DNA-directed RNA polymerase subunit M/transcription elongation factor TFIIS
MTMKSHFDTPHVLDFCGGCGSLLDPKIGLMEIPKCRNCDHLVAARSNRIQGVFNETEAEHFYKITGITNE